MKLVTDHLVVKNFLPTVNSGNKCNNIRLVRPSFYLKFFFCIIRNEQGGDYAKADNLIEHNAPTAKKLLSCQQ
jgi:hypothetical protein